MATFSRYEYTTRHIEYQVPAAQSWGAAWAEVFKAIGAALAEYRRVHGIDEAVAAADDWVWVFPGDDEIVIRFEVKQLGGAS